MKLLTGYSKYVVIKRQILAVDVLFRYHSEYNNLEEKEAIFFFSRCHNLDSEELVEHSIGNHASAYSCVVNGKGCDNTDGSEVKAVSFPHFGKNRRFKVNVKNKIGAIRLVVANPETFKADYFFIPKQAWENMKTKHDFLHFSWNEDNQWYSLRLSEFQVDSFEELVNA